MPLASTLSCRRAATSSPSWSGCTTSLARRASSRTRCDDHRPELCRHSARPDRAAGGRGLAGRALADTRGHQRRLALRAFRPCRHRLARQLSRPAAVRARPLSHHVHDAALDHPAICRLLNGRGIQRLLPPQPGGRSEGAVDRVRPRDPSRLRQRPSAGGGRCRHGRGRHQFHPRHAHAVRRHPARADERLDDHERCCPADPGPVRRGRRGAGGAAGQAQRHHPERHPQGVHGPQYLHLPAAALDADHFRHLRLHRPAHATLQLDQHLRLSHAGGGGHGRPRARLHAGRWRGLSPLRPCGRARHRQLCTPAQLLLGHRHELLHGGGEAQGGPPSVVEARRPVRSQGPEKSWPCARIARPRAGH